MLYDGMTQTSRETTTRQTPSRSIDEILARRQARLRRRRHGYPPDFTHGGVPLERIYEVLGARWVEEAIFIERFYDQQGELAAFSAGWFEGRFLTIDQAVRDEVDDLEARLADLEDGRRCIVELCVDRPSSEEEEGRLQLGCTMGRLTELERSHLGVVRDRQLSQPGAIYSQRDEVLLDSRINLLSLICLCAELAD